VTGQWTVNAHHVLLATRVIVEHEARIAAPVARIGAVADGGLVLPLHAEQAVRPAVKERPAAGNRHVRAAAVTGLVDAVVHVDVQALHAVVENQIDHTGHGAGTVGGGSATG